MNTATRLTGFGIGLLAVLGIGMATGSAVGPSRPAGDDHDQLDTHDRANPAPTAKAGAGVVSAAEGYRLVPTASLLPSGGGQFQFRILGPGERVVAEYTTAHERDLHLIVVDRELTTYHHLHPTLDPGGLWSVPVPALDPGAFRAIADFRVANGPALVLGTDLSVAGDYQPRPVPEPSTSAQVDGDGVDGYEVELTATPAAGEGTTADFTVRRAGTIVTDLQPYLGAAGHLVAIRTGDLAYAHVHPLGGAAHAITFAVQLPSAGRYRLFLDFKHGGVVRTASFTYDQVRAEKAGVGQGTVGNSPGEGH